MEVKTMFIIGAGAMGMGIAQIAAVAGITVYLNDLSQDQLAKAKPQIENRLVRMTEKGNLSNPDLVGKRITYTDTYENISEADIVIEAIYENLEAKKAIFKEISPKVKEDAILASNTSSLSLTSIAAAVTHPERFIGMHFFNPVPLMQLLEIVPGLLTSAETVAEAAELGKRLGKETIIAKDSPGFIVNRALVVMMNEAIFLLQEGVGTADDIDKGLVLGCNHPIGPLALADLSGLDIVLAVLEAFYKDFGDSKYRPCPLLRKMVDAKLLGIKTRQGFYKYDEKNKKIIN